MCDAGRLNYKWIGRPDRLAECRARSADGKVAPAPWATAIAQINECLRAAKPGSVAIIASARQTNEELFLLKRLAERVGAITDSVPRSGEGDSLLVATDKNPNSTGARLIGIAASPMGSELPKIAAGIRAGTIKTVISFGEDLTKHGIGEDLLRRLEMLIVSDILPNATTELAHCLLPGCAHAEKRGTFTNIKGRVQKVMKAVEAPGDSRAEWVFLQDILDGLGGNAPARSI